MTKKLKVVDLFSGIGMFSYGLHQTGAYQTKVFVEKDASCQEVLRKNFIGVPIEGDIAKFSTKNYSDCDVVVGGFPCQDISNAGTKLGLSGARSGLWSEFARVIKEVKPRGVIIENVSALRHRGLSTVLRDLNSLGYDAEWHCITAKNFGAYHERDRLWVIAYRNNNREQGFKPLQCLGEDRQRGKSRQEDMQQMFESPFGGPYSWPQPLIRGMDVQRPAWVDRIGQVGNTVYWPIVELLGKHLYENLEGRE